MMNKNLQDLISNAKSNPILEGIPDKLKTKEEFERIEKKINRIMYSDHKHYKPSAFIKCKRCSEKFEKKRKYIKEQGFKDMQQYFTYKKVMDIIINKKELKLNA